MKGWRRTFAAVALVAATTIAVPAQAGFLEDAGWGSLTILTNVVYMPAKLVYATLGGLTGGMAFALTGGDLDAANTVWVTSMSGTYVVTPPMLRGEEALVFAGVPGHETRAAAPVDESYGGIEEQQLSHAGGPR